MTIFVFVRSKLNGPFCRERLLQKLQPFTVTARAVREAPSHAIGRTPALRPHSCRTALVHRACCHLLE